MRDAMADELLGRCACDHHARTLQPIDGLPMTGLREYRPEPAWRYWYPNSRVLRT
jgi:hypothetical protein